MCWRHACQYRTPNGRWDVIQWWIGSGRRSIRRNRPKQSAGIVGDLLTVPWLAKYTSPALLAVTPDGPRLVAACAAFCKCT